MGIVSGSLRAWLCRRHFTHSFSQSVEDHPQPATLLTPTHPESCTSSCLLGRVGEVAWMFMCWMTVMSSGDGHEDEQIRGGL